MARRTIDRPAPVIETTPVKWDPGEHIAVIGRTGTGKTTLMASLVGYRDFVAFLRTKSDNVRFKDLIRTRDIKPMRNLFSYRHLIEPNFNAQADVMAQAIGTAWKQGGWTIFVDELFYMDSKLKLGRHVDMLLTQGRSKGISVVVGMQRPVQVTRFALSEVSHIFTFALEERERKTVSEFTSDAFGEVIGNLPRYHFAHYHVPTRTIRTGNARALPAVLIVPKKYSNQSRYAATDSTASQGTEKRSMGGGKPTGEG